MTHLTVGATRQRRVKAGAAGFEPELVAGSSGRPRRLSVMVKARELGRELARSREITAMHQAEMAMLQDPEAGAVVRDFNAKRQLFDSMAARGEEPDSKQKEEAAAIEARAQANPLIARFFAAQREVEELLEKINEEIGAGLAGAVVGSDCDSGDCGEGYPREAGPGCS